MTDETEIESETISTLPLDAWHRANGARMVPFAGYDMPIQYEGIIAEHEWTRSSAGLFDVSHMGQLTAKGEGVAEALEALMPGDFSALKPGRMRYSILLNEDGGALDDLMVTNAGGNFYLVVNGAVKWDDIAHLREHLPDHISLNHMADDALLALQGPKAVDALRKLGIVSTFEGAGGPEELSFMQAGPYAWGDVRLGISRSGYTGEDGFEISVAADHVEALAEALVNLDEVKPVGLGARDSLRLEAGLPLYAHDLTEQTDPVSAGLAFAISKARREQGGFPGADRILGNLTNGASTKRVGMKLEGRMAAREGAEIFANDTKVGTVTSGGFAPSVGGPIAMGYVEAAHAEIGTQLELAVRNKRIRCEVVAMPFVPTRYYRKPKGAA